MIGLWMMWVGCKSPTAVTTDPPVAEGQGLLGDHPLNPFPVGALHFAGGELTVDSADFGIPDTLTPLPLERLGFRDGFSPGQTSVVVLDSIEASALPHWSDPQPGASGVQLLDRTTGSFLPVFAELDAHPYAEPNTLLIRPIQALPYGHEIAVVLTTALTPRPDRFERLLAGDPPPELAEHAEAFRQLVSDIEAAGTTDIALAWSFPVGDGTAPTRSVWEQAVASGWTVQTVREGDAAEAPHTFRAVQGSFTTTEFLEDDLRLRIDGATGTVTPQGTTEAHFYVHIPASVADAPAGTVPVMVFGHGIFASPELYLDRADDASAVTRLCDEAGYIAIGTNWRGLTTPDLGGAINVSQDFGRMHELTDRLVQSQGNVTALIGMLRQGDFYDDPIFQGAQGQRLPSDRLVYYGISLGAIEGAVLQASQPDLDQAVLHVGGSTWSTMLERSSNWSQFEILLVPSITDPVARQRLYAFSQLWWDSVDPIAFTDELSDRSFLLQVAIGDEQVPNFTSYTLARSIGLAQVEPVFEPVFGMSSAATPLTRGLVQLDPEKELPPDANRPAPETEAHTEPRTWPGTRAQIETYLANGSIEHFCGTAPCSESNP